MAVKMVVFVFKFTLVIQVSTIHLVIWLKGLGPVKIWKIRWISVVNITYRKRTFWRQWLNIRCI